MLGPAITGPLSRRSAGFPSVLLASNLANRFRDVVSRSDPAGSFSTRCPIAALNQPEKGLSGTGLHCMPWSDRHSSTTLCLGFTEPGGGSRVANSAQLD